MSPHTNPSHRPPPPTPRVATVGLRGRFGAVAELQARPDLLAGLRAAVATVGPLLAASALGLPGPSWAGLAGFMTAVADKGGAYQTRARTLGAVALSGAAAAIAGGLAGTHPALAVPAVFVWATLAALLRAFGPTPGALATPSTIVFIVSLAAPVHGPGLLAERAGLFLAGSAAAMALSLLLWPVRAYRPARLALAECWRALAQYAGAVADGAPRDFAHFRTALEAARATLANTRRGRLAESGRGERLLMLAEQADRTFTATTALAGALDVAGEGAPAAECEQARATARAVARLAGELAAALERERVPPPPPEFPVDDEAAGDGWLPRLSANARREALRAWAAAAGVESGRRARTPVTPIEEAPPGVRETLAAHLDWRSSVLRHALRVGSTAAAATLLGQALGVQRGYWITLTALIVLQPSAGATWVKGLQRIGGTVAGGIAAAALGALVHDPRAMLGVIFVLAAAAVSVLQVNYGVYSALLTPTFVLLAETSAPDRHLPVVRVINTLLGGALALAAARLLWPAPERLAFAERLAQTLRASGAYVRAAAAAYAGAAPRAAVDEARRQTGLAVLNAEESLQLLLWEAAPGVAAEAGMAALAFLRRIGEAANALAYAPAAARADGRAIAAAGERAAETLGRLAELVEGGPPLEPPMVSAGELATAPQSLRAIADEIAALREVVARFAASETRPAGH